MLKNVVLFVVAVIVVLLVSAYLLPSQVIVRREIEIGRTANFVYPYLEDLRRWPEWTTWAEKNPKPEFLYSDPSTGRGAFFKWKSSDQGSGQVTLTDVSPDESVTYQLRVDHWDQPSVGTIRLVPTDQGTRVVWELTAELGDNPIHRWMGLFADNWIGKDFDKGLHKLSELSEKTVQ